MSVRVRAQGQLVLDTGGLFAWASGDRTTREIILRAVQLPLIIVVPTVVIARAIRGGARDAPIDRVLKQVTRLAPATLALARQAAVPLGTTATTDVADALVVAEALQMLPAAILTSDPTDIRHLLLADPAHPQVRVRAM